jgi:hypothetical protein
LNLHDIVQVQAKLRELSAAATDLPFVVQPARLVLVAAHRDVAEDDVAVAATGAR